MGGAVGRGVGGPLDGWRGLRGRGTSGTGQGAWGMGHGGLGIELEARGMGHGACWHGDVRRYTAGMCTPSYAGRCHFVPDDKVTQSGEAKEEHQDIVLIIVEVGVGRGAAAWRGEPGTTWDCMGLHGIAQHGIAWHQSACHKHGHQQRFIPSPTRSKGGSIAESRHRQDAGCAVAGTQGHREGACVEEGVPGG